MAHPKPNFSSVLDGYVRSWNQIRDDLELCRTEIRKLPLGADRHSCLIVIRQKALGVAEACKQLLEIEEAR